MKTCNLLIKVLLPLIFILMIACSGDKSVDGSQATVTGTLSLPEEAMGQAYYVIIDNDIDGDNGYDAICWGDCGAGESMSYSIDNVPSGTYYIYAIVRIESADGPPEDGDYFGIYGGTYSDPPSQPNAVIPSSGSVTFDITLEVLNPPPATVTGTLTLPADAEGKRYYVCLEDDIYDESDFIAVDSGDCGPGESIDYSIDEVPSGTYYAYAWVRVVSTDGPAEDGDYFGIYGGTFAELPAQPNAVVPSTGTVTFDITMEVLSTEIQPQPGEWSGDAGFGSLDFTVNAEGTAITQIKYNFSNFTCGGVTQSGSITVNSPSGWPITDGEFSITNYLMDKTMKIEGSFDINGESASGSYSATVNSSTCTGTWTAFPAK